MKKATVNINPSEINASEDINELKAQMIDAK